MVIPNHPFIKFCIDNLPKYVNSYYYFGKHLHVMNSTGPLFLTKMIKAYGEKNIQNLYVLNNNEFAGDCNVCSEHKCKGGIYFKHIVGNSWHSLDSTIYNILLCSYKKIILVVLLLIMLCVFFKRNKVFKLKKILKI
jgi:mannosyltransferase OCH1-like enzyme